MLKKRNDKESKTSNQDPKTKYIYLVFVLAGLIMVITFWPTQNNREEALAVKKTDKPIVTNSGLTYEETLEKKLENMLKIMEGVGEVNVMVTLASNEEKVLAGDSTVNIQQSDEKDKAGGTRVSQSQNEVKSVVMQNGNVPYVIKEKTPEIKGVFVVAQGGGNDQIKLSIINSISSLLEIPVHKISVEKRK